MAATGFGLAGVVHGYVAVWLLLLLSGLGVAMFHPPAGRDARREAGESATAMSYFAAGGSVGFFLGPTLATPVLDTWGLGATAVFIPPGLLMGFILWRHLRRLTARAVAERHGEGVDRPRMFALLIAVEVARSSVSFGVNAFVALYWIKPPRRVQRARRNRAGARARRRRASGRCSAAGSPTGSGSSAPSSSATRC